MFQPVFDFLGLNYPAILILIASCVAVCYVTVYVMRRLNAIARVESDLSDLKASADCKVHHAAIENSKEAVTAIQSSIEAISKSITAIEKAVIFTNPQTFDALAKINSPKQLSDIGLEIYNHYKVDDFLAKHIDSLIVELESKNINSALDIEQESYLLLLVKSDEPTFNDLKTLVYNAPQYKGVNVNITTLCFVMSLELRNEYLRRHPEIV